MVDEVPEWCSFFTATEFERFRAAVDDALSAFGAEGQEIGAGIVALAAGAPAVDVHEFPLDSVALQCRNEPVAEWKPTCFRLIHEWVDGTPQRKWLTERAFDEIAGRLDVWLSSEPPREFAAPDDHPAQPHFTMVHGSLGVSLWTEVPELGDLPPIPAFVPNAAVEAWGVSFGDLMDAARERLLSLPPPEWGTTTVNLLDDDGAVEADVEIHYLESEPTDVPQATAWSLVLPDVAPRELVPGALVAMPLRRLVLLSYPDPKLTEEQRLQGIAHHADHAWNFAEEERLSPWDYRLDDDLRWQAIPRDDPRE